jgi:hypothetical protein
VFGVDVSCLRVYSFFMLSFRQWLRGRRPPPTTTVVERSRTLEALTRDVPVEQAVRRDDLGLGDVVLVRTRNSCYSLLNLGDGTFWVSGGWFDQQGVSPATVTVNGCTWGGSVIKTDIVAGRGLCLEFGNRVVTTRIQSVRLIRAESSDSVH